MSKILIIDDDRNICDVLEKKFKRMDHEVFCFLTLKDGLNKLYSDKLDIVFLDVNLPDGNGLESIERIKELPMAPEVIIMTGNSNPEGAELAIKSKAWDYIQKSGSHKEFEFSLTRALKYRFQKQSKTQGEKIRRGAIIGESGQMKACLEILLKAANNDIPTLITGETGTGKELFAKAIHENSSRQENDFIVVDCAALPEHLVESVLFGHSKGAFTGADSNRVGLITLADGGTLFLDEVGELPMAVQKKFLRVLQEKNFRPVGGKKEISSNFRLVSATHRKLTAMTEKGRFREDFYFRIASRTIEIPPLRDRKSDIPSLLTHRLDRQKSLFNEPAHDISQEFLENLLGYDWPGNVRELFGAIDYACSDSYSESMLFSKHLPDYIRTFNIKKKIKHHEKYKSEPSRQQTDTSVASQSFKTYIETKKQTYITALMAHTRGNIKSACHLSGLSRGHLYTLLKKFNINSV